MEVELDSNLKWLVLGEVIIIAFVFLIRFIFNKMQEHKETKNIDKVLKYIDKKSKENKDVDDKFRECIEIIKQNNKTKE